MKKAIMSLGALLLSGVVLASCGNSSASIKKPSKGKAVSEVSFKAYNDDDEETNISIKKSDSFDDIMAALVKMPTIYISRNYSDDETAMEESYTSKTTYVSKMRAKNYYSSSQLFDNYETNIDSSSSEDYYYKMTASDEKDEDLLYDKSISKMSSVDKKNKYSETRKMNYESGIAGSYTVKRESGSISERSVDGGKYFKYSGSNAENYVGGKEKSSGSSNSYEYLNATEKRDDENYNATYYGYDDEGNEHSYKISEFLSIKSMPKPYYSKIGGSVYPSTSVPTSVELSDFYSDTVKDYTNGSFDITDKYIIIKMDTTYDSTIRREAKNFAGKDATNDQIKAKYDELIKGDYKGTKTNYEIWIDYTNESARTAGYKYLTFGYLKYNRIMKLNRKGTYDDSYYSNYGITDEETKALLNNKKYSINGNGNQLMEIAVNSSDYSKKIKSMKDTCKKNNIYDDIVMKPNKYFW